MKRMKAYVLQDIGDIRLKEMAKPMPGAGEALVKVRACGICGSDIPRIYRNGTHRMPLIPGHEFAGEVVELGRGVDESLLHKRVGVFPLIPCGKCAACQRGTYELCRNYDYLGSRRDGGFAEYAAVPAGSLLELPAQVSFEEAAMFEPMAVAVHAMRRVKPGREEKTVICGLGTIGLLLLEFLREAGCRKVYAIGNKSFQRETALKEGLPEENYCDSRGEDVRKWLMERTDGAGADVFFECVGRNETIMQAVDLSGMSGRVCLMGNPFGDVRLPRDVYWKILRNQLRVTGTWNSAFTGEADDDWNYAAERIRSGKVRPKELITHRYPLEELGAGFEIMRDKTQDYIKIMGVVEG